MGFNYVNHLPSIEISLYKKRCLILKMTVDTGLLCVLCLLMMEAILYELSFLKECEFLFYIGILMHGHPHQLPWHLEISSASLA
jgi:hypothetical protein